MPPGSAFAFKEFPVSPVPATPLDPRLLQALQGIDLTSADGRAGLRTLLAEIARLSPDAVLQQAAGIDLRRIGWRPACPDGEAPRAGR